MKKPKIQLHIPDLYVGGIETWALTLMRGLGQIEWLVSTPAGAIRHEIGLSEFGAYQLADEDHSIPVDAVITTWGLKDRGIVPTVAVAHSAFEHYKRMMRSVRRDYAVAVSRAACQCFPETEPVEVIYNGVDLKRLQRREAGYSIRARLGIASDAIVIGYVGRWGRQKNPLAAAMAAQHLAGAVVLYVGPLPDEDLRSAAMGLADCRFVIPEEVSAIGDLYRAIDVCVFASRSEGFGLSIAEAWYCGVPVAATKVGIVAEHPDFVTLLPDDPSAADLQNAVAKVLADRATLDLESPCRMVAGTYSADVMIEKWDRYISEVLR